MDLSARAVRLQSYEDELVKRYGTPSYVFFEEDIRQNYRDLRNSLNRHYPDSQIYFAVKSNFLLGVLSILRDEGCGAEAYARGELQAALTAGFNSEDILLTGLNRREADLEQAFETGVPRYLIDNTQELQRVATAAEHADTTADVLIRVNPAMEVPTHPEVATATRESKFGLDIASGKAMDVARDVCEQEMLNLVGVQLHVGSQVRGVEPYRVAARELIGFASRVQKETGTEISVLDLGGGFPVPYDESVVDSEEIIAAFSETIKSEVEEYGLSRPTVFVEPGRRLIGNAGTLVAEVGVIKATPETQFAVLDAGTNAVSSYWPYPIYSLTEGAATESYDVAGPLCYTGDVIQEDVSLPELSVGDKIAVDRIGAYSLGSASHTNAEPKPGVVLVREDGSLEELRPQETPKDVFGNNQIPSDLQ
ncbi:diaminopimelate decarboxylase [Haloprofundus marisrubri]|uniref:Diaminopimelate decarboxylase n=1 Tax=Haloprofundus marisrubri TaxID=1514971 RepID=A0A0W1RFL6_9EURY|nr:diaminopimelate decarboxylase [Haloprofundus marisrubri]KTG11460.1 diaminopimelate decarboxylase [Haloprofundus marisrubri]